MRGVAAVVFDLDGTLVDSRRDIAAATNHALARAGRPALATEIVASYVGDGARSLVSRAADLEENDPAVDALLDDFLAYYASHALDFTTPMPGAEAALDSLARLPLAVATNKPRPTTEAVLEGLGLRRRFSVVVAGTDPLPRKPAPDQLVFVAEQLRISPWNLVMVGDGPQDVEAGRAAGCRTVGVEGGLLPRARLVAAGPDALVGSLAELPQLLSSWGAPVDPA